MDLKEIRQEIDSIDRQLVNLFCQRMDLSAHVAEYKKENGLPIIVPEREQQILRQITEQAGPEMAPYLRELYAAIFEESRRYQAEVIK